jgi:hypothetical protein
LTNSDLPAVRYALKEFMEEQAPSNFSKERWKASYDPAWNDLLREESKLQSVKRSYAPWIAAAFYKGR